MHAVISAKLKSGGKTISSPDDVLRQPFGVGCVTKDACVWRTDPLQQAEGRGNARSRGPRNLRTRGSGISGAEKQMFFGLRIAAPVLWRGGSSQCSCLHSNLTSRRKYLSGTTHKQTHQNCLSCSEIANEMEGALRVLALAHGSPCACVGTSSCSICFIVVEI